MTHAYMNLVIEIKWLRDRLETQEALLNSLRRSHAHSSDRPREARRLARMVPSSSDVYCQGVDRRERTCRFRNLCMSTRPERFFILRGEHSLLINTPQTEMEVLDLTTLDNHNQFFWRWEEVPYDFFLRRLDRLALHTFNISTGRRARRINDPLSNDREGSSRLNLTIVRGTTYLTKRFFPVNIMHVFHDDWLGLFALRDYWPSLRDDSDNLGLNKRLERELFRVGVNVFEHHGKLSYDGVYDWLGRFNRVESLLGWPSWHEEEKTRPQAFVCWEDVVVGNRKDLAWYQYGYGKAQGPITGHNVTGYRLREAAAFALAQLGLSEWDEQYQLEFLRAVEKRKKTAMAIHQGNSIDEADDGRAERRKDENIIEIPKREGACIAIFSRLSTRLILNEPELARHLTAEFGLPICWVRLEKHTIPELIGILSRAPMAFGMHGSLLVLAMFMPPGAVLIEGYPYGVPAENYTPYRTMTQLRGMRMTYRSWTASSSKDVVGHPERSAREGGIRHLNHTMQQFILQSSTIPTHPCCDNPHWLYRIFQDTRVNPRQIVGLFREALSEALWKEEDRLRQARSMDDGNGLYIVVR